MTEHMDHGELRDRLADLVHGTGDAPARARVEEAVAADAALADELAFLVTARAALTPRAVPVAVDRIVAAIPPYARRRGVRMIQWRVAAAIATIAIGGVSLSLVQQVFRGDRMTELAVVGAESSLVADASDGVLSITFGQGLAELTEDELEDLLSGLSRFDGLPSVEPGRSVPVLPAYDEGGD